MRLRDVSGGAAPTPARVRLFTGLAGGPPRASLLEEAEGPPLRLDSGAAVAELPAAGTVTMVLTPGPGPAPATPADRGPARGAAGARPARVHPVLAARQGPGPGREPAGGRPPLPRPDRPARRAAARCPAGGRVPAAHRGLRPGAGPRHGGPGPR